MSQQTTHLTRSLTTLSLVLFGLAYLTPMVVLAIFGVVATTAEGATPAAYLLALIAMLFTAASYGKMSRIFPVAGSAYTYVRKTLHPHLGFLVGWAVLLDYLFLPLVIWLIGASYLAAAFPQIPAAIWVILFVVITTILNILGVKVAERANLLLMAFQLLVLLFFVILSFSKAATMGSIFTLNPFLGEHGHLAPITAAAAIAAYSFLGFDAVTTLTEETINPEKAVPRAVMLVAFIGGLIFIVVSYTATLVHPGSEFANPDAAATEIVAQISGPLFGAIFLAGLIIAQFASGISAQAAGSRLLFAMGRDGVLPPKLFGQLGQRFHTPVFNLVITGLVGLLAIFLDVTVSTSFINFGGFIAFACVNLAVIGFFCRNRNQIAGFTKTISFTVLPAIGFVICGFLLTQLDVKAQVTGLVWLLIGMGILAKITAGFRKLPPEMTA